jgi:alanyl-tRNA synthetase
VLARDMGDAYPDLRVGREMIEKTILAEEHRFEAVLTEGLPRLEAEIKAALGTPDRTLGGDVAFRLYDTFGVPYDFIEDTAATRDVRVDKAGFDLAMEGQREKARAKSAFDGHQDRRVQRGGRRIAALGGRPVRRLYEHPPARNPGSGAVRCKTETG